MSTAYNAIQPDVQRQCANATYVHCGSHPEFKPVKRMSAPQIKNYMGAVDMVWVFSCQVQSAKLP